MESGNAYGYSPMQFVPFPPSIATVAKVFVYSVLGILTLGDVNGGLPLLPAASQSRCWYDFSCRLPPRTMPRTCRLRYLELNNSPNNPSKSLVVNCSSTVEHFKDLPLTNPGDEGFHPTLRDTASCSNQVMWQRAATGSMTLSGKLYLFGCFCSSGYGSATNNSQLQQCVYSLQTTGGSSGQCPQARRMVVIPCSYRQAVTNVIMLSQKPSVTSSPQSTTDLTTETAAVISQKSNIGTNVPVNQSQILLCHFQLDCRPPRSVRAKRTCNFWLRKINTTVARTAGRFLYNESAVLQEFKESPVLTRNEIGFHFDVQHKQDCAERAVLRTEVNSTTELMVVTYQLACFCRYTYDPGSLPRLEQCAYNIKTGNDTPQACPVAYRTVVLPRNNRPTSKSQSPQKSMLPSTSATPGTFNIIPQVHTAVSNSTAIAMDGNESKIITGMATGSIGAVVLVIFGVVMYKCSRRDMSVDPAQKSRQPTPVSHGQLGEEADIEESSVLFAVEQAQTSTPAGAAVEASVSAREAIIDNNTFLLESLSLDDIEMLLEKRILSVSEHEQVIAAKENKGRTEAVRKLMSFIRQKPNQQIISFFIYISLPEEEKRARFGAFLCTHATPTPELEDAYGSQEVLPDEECSGNSNGSGVNLDLAEQAVVVNRGDEEPPPTGSGVPLSRSKHPAAGFQHSIVLTSTV